MKQQPHFGYWTLDSTSRGALVMKRLKVLIVIALAAATAACVGSQAFREAHEEETLGHWDVAVLKYGRACDLNPGNTSYKLSLARAKMKASQSHFEKGKVYRNSGNPDLAVVELEQAVLLDPTNKYAETELRKAREDAARLEAERSGETKLETMKRRVRGQRARAPILEPMSDKPISLNFPQPKPIKQIYLALATSVGINVIFDPQLKDENVSIVLNNIEFQKALETLMRQENHFYKIIDDKTILIAADNAQNRKTYEDLVLRTFYLSNGDLTDVSNAIRSLLQTTRLSVNKGENSITLRDTADKVAIAERIVEQNDKQVSEVVIDVELLQVNTQKMQEIGLILDSYSIGASMPAPGGTTSLGAAIPAGGAFTWNQLTKASLNAMGFTIPSATVNLIKNNSDAELLAKPQLRISEGQKAQLVIGDKVPIPTTTFNTNTALSGGTVLPITSFQYQDVGIKIDVEPRVHHNKEITMKLIIEVSNLGEPVDVGNGQKQPVIQTRTITANIRLKDGETNFLAGLYRVDKKHSKSGLPFLQDIPILGRLFSDTLISSTTTDIILTLTPHIIRIPDITEEDLAPVYVGTDANISFQGTPRIESPAGSGPFDFQRQQPPVLRPPAPAAVPPAVAPQSVFPDPFKPTPPPSQPKEPQTEVRQPNTQLESTAAAAAPANPVFSFDPSFVSLAPGQQRSLVLRAAGDVLTSDSVIVQFDPRVAAVMFARPVLAVDGVADARIEGGRVVLQLPAGTPLSGTRPVAELTIVGVAPGRAILAVEAAGAGASAVVEVR
jgi:general secretion pathway protein D